MSCLMYSRGECRKQPIGATSRASVGLFSVAVVTQTTFAACQFDGRVWFGSTAYAGRVQDLKTRHEQCAMFVPGPGHGAPSGNALVGELQQGGGDLSQAG